MCVDTVSYGSRGPGRKGGDPGLYRARIGMEKGRSGRGWIRGISGEAGLTVIGAYASLPDWANPEGFN